MVAARELSGRRRDDKDAATGEDGGLAERPQVLRAPVPERGGRHQPDGR
jgi:hypothetical protein